MTMLYLKSFSEDLLTKIFSGIDSLDEPFPE